MDLPNTTLVTNSPIKIYARAIITNRRVIKEETIAITSDCASKIGQLVSHWDVTTGDYFETRICDKNAKLRPFTHSSYNEWVIQTYMRLSEA